MNKEMSYIKIFRYDPEKDAKPHYQDFMVPFEKGMTVLDTLNYIYENQDSTLAYNYGCRYGYCGICAVKVNGIPSLSCRTQATMNMKIEPLSNFPIIRDLVIDREKYDERIDRIRPFLERKAPAETEPEVLKPKDFETFRVVSRCIDCLACMSGCPSYSEDSYEFSGPTLMTELARFTFDPRDCMDRISIANSEGLYNCTECGQCTEVCPHKIDIPKLIIGPSRQLALAEGKIPGLLLETIEFLNREGRAYPQPTPPALSLMVKMPAEELVKEKIDRVAWFVGCNIDYDSRLQAAGVDGYNLLKRNGVEVLIPKEQLCCGEPFLEAGADDQINSLVKRNVELFKSLGTSRIVTMCAGCSMVLKNEYPQVYKNITGENLDFEIIDLAEYITRYIKLNYEKMGALNIRVTYHDPCHLKRYQKISKEPRDIIKSIPGIKLVEMEEPDRCCGGGGEVRVTNRRLAMAMAKRKAEMIRKANVNAVVTCCPTCMLQLSSGLQLSRVRGVEVLHITTLLERAYIKALKMDSKR